MDDHLIYKDMDNVERNSDISWYLNVFKMNLDGCSIVGISESLGVNLNSCKSAHRRVKRSLKAELKRLHYDRY